jgi:hypothetical protein
MAVVAPEQGTVQRALQILAAYIEQDARLPVQGHAEVRAAVQIGGDTIGQTYQNQAANSDVERYFARTHRTYW